MRAIFFLAGVVLLLPVWGDADEAQNPSQATVTPSAPASLAPWQQDGQIIGVAREVASPKNVWLMFHGDLGPAAGREAVLAKFAAEDAVYIMEYPGSGSRDGRASCSSFESAAKEAYLALRQKHADTPVGVVGESIGSGPASYLAFLTPPPDKIVLLVPFNKLSDVPKSRDPEIKAEFSLRGKWNNEDRLSSFFGAIDIFAAESDEVIPPEQARALANAVPSARLTMFPGGHRDWMKAKEVAIRNP